MNEILTIVGTIASLGGIPLSIYLYLKSKEARFDRIKKEIVKILSYQIGEERELTMFEIQTVINSKLRESRFKVDSINIEEIIEDLVAETISSPMIDRTRKKQILNNLRSIYIKGALLDKIDDLKFNDAEKISWENIEPKMKSIIESRKALENSIESISNKGESIERISTWFATIATFIGLITAVLGSIGHDFIEKVVKELNENQKIGEISVAVLGGIVTSLIAGALTTLLKKRKTTSKTNK